MKNKLLLNIDLRIICALLLVVIAGMLAFWRPWEIKGDDRSITITGQAEVEAVPDQFVFSPRFERSGTDAATMKNELNDFGTQLQSKLIELGIKKEDITLNSSSYDGIIKPEDSNDGTTVALSVMIKAPNQELAQKVQDYLATTDAKGQLTAAAQFSDAKRRDLENQARSKAVEDARSKAERTVKNLDATLGKVIEVKDVAGFGVLPVTRENTETAGRDISLPVTPGKDSVTFTIEVSFELR
jgi:uncharacterized protein YggE